MYQELCIVTTLGEEEGGGGYGKIGMVCDIGDTYINWSHPGMT